DGIRDLIVTGVQTCALPISPRTGVAERGPAVPHADRVACDCRDRRDGDRDQRDGDRRPRHTVSPPPPRWTIVSTPFSIITSDPRSEERRVGKECRDGWAA